MSRTSQPVAATCADMARATAGGACVVAPASFSQERLWLTQQLQHDNPVAHISAVIRCNSPLNMAALERAFAAIVRRHEVLRTHFVRQQGQLVQVIRPEADVLWQTIDLQPIGEGTQRLRQLHRRLAACEKLPFPLNSGPLLRCYVYTLGPAEHVLQLVAHQAVFDAGSCSVLMRELGVLYPAFETGDNPDPDELPSLRMQYQDFARAQRARLQAEGMARLRTYWSRQLADLSAPLELPTDRPRPAVPIQRRERVTGLLPAPLVAGVQSAAQRSGATVFTTFLAAFNVLLFRYGGTRDITVATPMAGRDEPGLETLIGPCVSTVVIRCRIDPGSLFTQLLEQVEATVLAAREHQDMPFEQLVEWLQPGCVASQAPLTPVMFALRCQAGETGGGWMQTVSINSPIVTAAFDLSMEIAEYPDGWRCCLEYATELFDRETIERMLKHFEVLLAGIVTDARQTVARIPLLTPQERQQILVSWNACGEASSAAGCIHHWFERRVSQQPEAVALTYEGQSITYAQLNERSNRLAHYLLGHHVGPESRIALCIERSTEMVVAVLATLKSGAAYVPLDPTLPRGRVEFILADSGASLVLTQKSVRRERLQNLAIPLFCLDADAGELADYSPMNVSSGVAGHHCAYVLYTSGSTGTPKGVAVTHDSVMNTLEFLEARHPLGHADSYLLKTNYVFDISVTELFGWFIGCGRLVILPSGLEGSPDVLADYVVRYRTTHINFSPSLFQGFLLEVRHDPRFRDRAALKCVMSGGEALPKHLVKEAIDVLGPAPLENLYGPTETAVYCTAYSCAAPIASRHTPIGRPLPDMQVYVLDEYLQPVPVGISGELCVAGRGLARGYLNRPDLTAEKFIAHPFAASARLYRTGDRVRWLPQGELEYLGRADHQVKVRGMRVELGEIEARMLGSEWVRAAVVALQPAAEGERLVGYVVPSAERAARMGLCGRDVASTTARDEFIADLRRVLQQSLPDYMVPGLYVTLSQFPLNRAGKVDRAALTVLPVESGERHAHYVAPRTESEKTLCSIWQEVLRLDQVGIRDNFFAAGGDSILSIQVAFKARGRGLYLGARQLFQHQTIEELAAQARIMAPSQSAQECAGDMVLLPTHRQLLEHGVGAEAHCCQHRLLRVPEGFSLEFLRKAVGALYRQHDALRLRYRKVAGVWQARFAEFRDAMVETTIQHESLVWATEADPGRALDEWINATGESLDIESGPLFVAAVRTRSEPAGCRLLLVLHDLVADEVSWRVILEDLARAFTQWYSGQPIELPAETHSYQRWGAALADPEWGGAWDRERDYWLANSSHAAEPLVVDRADPRSMPRARQMVRWSKEETTALSRCHGAYRTHTDELLLAGLLFAFYRGMDRRALRLTLSGNGREAAVGRPHEAWELGRTVGCFTCYYPLTLSLPDIEDDSVEGGERFRGEIIKTVKERYRGTPNHGVGYGVLRYLVQDNSLDTVASGAPVEVVFKGPGRLDCYTDIPDVFPVVAELRGSARAWVPGNHLLGFSASVDDGCLSLEIDYDSRQLETETVQRVARMYAAALREIIIHCQRPGAGGFTPSDFPLLQLQPKDIEHWHALYPRLENIYPITGLQLGLLFHSRLEGSGATYSNQMWVTLGGELDVAAFKQAWSVVVARHAILRTAFVGMEREQPLQLVVSEATPTWRELDHRDIPCEDADTAFNRCRLYEKTQPFNFSRPCLLRLLLIHTAESQHRFVWTYHHSILDGWSGGLLWSEVLRAYHALAQGSVPRLPSVIPFSDYVQWLQRQDRSVAASYWRKELAGIERVPTLSIQQEGLQAESADYLPVCGELSEAETLELQQAARSAQVTLATVLQAAWACLLHLYCADTTVTFGVTISGRAIDLPGIEAIAGLFINTVPARVLIEATARIADWLRSLQQAQVEREAHGFMALLDIQRCSGMRAGNALFDSVLVVENQPLEITLTTAPLTAVDYQNDARTHYGLALLVMPGERLSLSLQFDPARFARADVSSMATRLKSILQRLAVAAPGDTVNSLYAPTIPVSKPESAHRHTSASQSSALRQGELRLGRYLVPQLIENQARRFPGKVAVLYNEEVYTYDALNRMANRMANGLLSRFPSLRADSLIGVMLPRSDKLLVTILAIWKTGAAYIPLDPALPGARIQQMLQNANALLVITEHESLARHPCDAWGIAVTTWDAIEQGPDTAQADPDINISSHDLSYVIYTSGSTGIPKGAMVEHIGMLNNIANKVIDLEIGDSSRVAQTASQSFDISVWQMFIALTRGATTVIYDDRVINDIGRFMQRLHDDCITVVEMVPSYLVLVTEYLAERPREELPACLRFLVLTGESADASFIKQWWRHFPNTKVVNAYGPTEASDDITHHVLSRDDDIENPVPVGRPLANFDIYIVDELLNPVPVGEKGEVVVTGVGVGRGYINLAGATAKAFVDSPFADKYRGRLYKTGDMGQLRADGVLLFHGRKDGQVKVRGFRVELEEVELRLLEITSVRQAVVLDITVPGAETSLCAFVVPYGVADREALLDSLGQKLPAYMVPTEWCFLEALPLLSNGKVNRRALRDLRTAAVSSTAYRAPCSELEIRLAAIWCEVLRVERIGIDADFFELGGDSFKAIRIAAKYGGALEVTDIYNSKTIGALAARLEGQGHAESRRIVALVAAGASTRVAVLGISNSAGDPVSFLEMGRELAAVEGEIALYAVKLPRRPVADAGGLSAEIGRLTEEICTAIAREIPVPLILFGQCNGSALAISIAQRLQKNLTPPRAVCIGGALLRTFQTPPDERNDREIIETLQSMGASLPQQPDELAFFLNDFRYDCELADSYYNTLLAQMNAGCAIRIDAPIYCLAGSEDPLVAGYTDKFRDWARLSDQVSLIEFAGHGHYLLRDCPRELAVSLRDIRRGLE